MFSPLQGTCLPRCLTSVSSFVYKQLLCVYLCFVYKQQLCVSVCCIAVCFSIYLEILFSLATYSAHRAPPTLRNPSQWHKDNIRLLIWCTRAGVGSRDKGLYVSVPVCKQGEDLLLIYRLTYPLLLMVAPYLIAGRITFPVSFFVASLHRAKVGNWNEESVPVLNTDHMNQPSLDQLFSAHSPTAASICGMGDFNGAGAKLSPFDSTEVSAAERGLEAKFATQFLGLFHCTWQMTWCLRVSVETCIWMFPSQKHYCEVPQ